MFDRVTGDGRGGVEAVGRSECSDPRLAGPARWHAVARDGRIAKWQVSDV